MARRGGLQNTNSKLMATFEGVTNPFIYAIICRQPNWNKENLKGMGQEAQKLLSRRSKDGGERNSGSL